MIPVKLSFQDRQTDRSERERERGITNLQHFAYVASTEDPVNNGELVRIIRWEIRSKDTVLSTPAPEQLARGTG